MLLNNVLPTIKIIKVSRIWYHLSNYDDR